MILEFTVWLLWELILYNIGRAVIAVFSLGRARAESLKEALRTSEPAIGVPGTQVVIPAMWTQFVGVAAFMLAITLLLAFRK